MRKLRSSILEVFYISGGIHWNPWASIDIPGHPWASKGFGGGSEEEGEDWRRSGRGCVDRCSTGCDRLGSMFDNQIVDRFPIDLR